MPRFPASKAADHPTPTRRSALPDWSELIRVLERAFCSQAGRVVMGGESGFSAQDGR